MKPGPDNPRAFPSGAIDDRFGGMTLWDHYAGQALAGLAACPTIRSGVESPGYANMAAQMADAMIAERAKRMGEA